MVDDALPDVVEAVAGERAAGEHRDGPAGVARLHHPQRPGQLPGRGARRADVLAVGLVDRDDVGELEDALLDALQLVARAASVSSRNVSNHAGHRGLRLTDSHRLDQHHVVAGRLHDRDRLAAGTRDASQHPGAGGGAARTRAGCSPAGPMRVLSPRIEPPPRAELGSTARTATR
jgi:hypothetical protein